MIEQQVGPYKVVARIGEGGMGAVYEAVDAQIGKRVAIKVLHKEHAKNQQISNRFISDEIRQLGRMGMIVPSIFLGVAAFLLNVVLSRIISLQRDQIAALKAFGYSNFDVGMHYLKLVMLITRRHLIDKLRRRGVRIDAASLDAEPAMPASEVDRGDPRMADRVSDEQKQWLRERLQELPDLQRSVIERTYLQGFTLREVSEQLKHPLGTVKSALSRGLLRLRDRPGNGRALG